MTSSKLYQKRDQTFYTGLISGESAADFSHAKYELFEQFGKEPICIKQLGAGIEIEGEDFKTNILAADVPKAGKFYHQFTVTNQLNQVLPPIFSGEVQIKEVR